MEKFIEPPDMDSYSLSEKSPYKSISLPGGPPRVRMQMFGSWQPLNVTWTFNPEEYRYFQSFYQGLIDSGYEPFLLDLYSPKGELEEYVVRFIPDGLSVRPGQNSFQVGHSLLVKPNETDDDGGAFFDAF